MQKKHWTDQEEAPNKRSKKTSDQSLDQDNSKAFQQMPKYMVQCRKNPCNVWLNRYPEVQTPDAHWHCLDKCCPTRGLLGEKPGFSGRKPSNAMRHADSHERAEQQRQADILEIWRHVCTKSGSLNRKNNEKHITAFRRQLPDQEHPQGTSDTWQSRLYIGKAGDTGQMLESVIERFGTCPAQGLRDLNNHVHAPNTSCPEPGHTIRFVPREEEDDIVWYGLCCGTFEDKDVFGDTGPACLVRWFDRSHDGPWHGSSATFYHLTGAKQHQLLEAMEDWGHLLDHDPTTGLFVLPQDGDEAESTASEDHDMRWYEELVRTTREDAEGSSVCREDLVAFDAVFPSTLLYFVDCDGNPSLPISCVADAGTDCVWAPPFRREFLKLPLTTPDGPIFLRPVRYHCSAHATTVQAGSREDADPYTLNIPYYRLGDMRYATQFLPDLQASYVENLTIASCRRRVLDRWLSSALQRLTEIKQRQAILALRTGPLQRAARALLALPDFTPSDESLAELQLVIFQHLVLPHVAKYDAAVAAFDGQLIRIDGTFKSATVVHANDPQQQEGRTKRVTKKVAGVVLVAVGTEGLCLSAPRLAPSESSQSIANLVEYILRGRRAVLGSLSAPAGFCTDSIRHHKRCLWLALCAVYPEVKASVNADELDPTDQVLMLQDIPHREWVFTKKIGAPKTHADYIDYVAAIKDVFHQLRVPCTADLANDWENKARTWTEERDDACSGHTAFITQQGYDVVLLRGLLDPEECGKPEEVVLNFVLRTLGNAGTMHAASYYIPRRLLVRAARRLHFTEVEVSRLFPDHGYPTGKHFLAHLEGVNTFYKVRRSSARRHRTSTVARRLGKPRWNAVGGVRHRGHRRQSQPSSDEDGSDSDDTGISDKQLTVDALIACSDFTVQ